MTVFEIVNGISEEKFDVSFRRLYGYSDKTILRQRARYINAAENFSRLYPECENIEMFSASGYTEICGNHTDHQHGCVLAAAVDMDIIALVGFDDSNVVNIKTENSKEEKINLDYLDPISSEKGTLSAIVRGIAAGFAKKGLKTGGFSMYAMSDIPNGRGFSSLTAFENLISTIFDIHYNNGEAGAVERAKISQFSENIYFGNECSLVGQTVSSVGGFVLIDFANPSAPLMKSVSFDFMGAGYSLCITETGSSGFELTDEEIKRDMLTVANAMNKNILRRLRRKDFFDSLPDLRRICSDRAVLRAAHFFDESERAVHEAEAIERGDTEEFFRLVNESGNSCFQLLQNLFQQGNSRQEVPLAVMLTKNFLEGAGAVRVNGESARTLQAFVPSYMAESYAEEMNRIFGQGSCHIHNIRSVGGTVLERV